jgi:hypothetical protein
MTRLDAHRAGAYVRNLASQCERATLAEHRGKPFKHPHPAMTHLPHRFRLRFLRQGELAASPARIECDGHTLEVQRVFLDGKCEHQSMGPNDFEMFADMLDILAVAPLHDVKPASGTRIDLDAYDLSLAAANNHLPAVLESSQASKTRCGEALNRRVTRALIVCSRSMEIVILFRPPDQMAGVHLR